MIQRIQSIWLFLSSVFIFALFLFPYLQFIDVEGIAAALKIDGLYGVMEGEVRRMEVNWLQFAMTIFVGILPLYIIFQFKNRKKQISLVLLTLTLMVLFQLWLYFSSVGAVSEAGYRLTTTNLGVGFFLIPLSLVFLLLALSGIRKDEKLIRSADRLR